MSPKLPRCLLIAAAVILLAGVALHTAAFPKVTAAVAKSDLPPIFGRSLQALWLIDSLALTMVALIFLAVAVWPAAAGRIVIVLVALIPLGIGIVLLIFMGPKFPPVLLMVVVAGLALVAAASKPAP